MKSPSTEWREQVPPGEAEKFQEYAGKLQALQTKSSARFGNGRLLHRKQLLALRARFEVLPDVPAHARFGLFARPGQYDAQVRLSNGSPARQADRKPDIRGFAVKVLGVKGPGALGNETDSQSFLLINHEAFSSARAEPFLELLLALSQGTGALLKHLLSTYGIFGAIGKLRRLAAIQGKPFSGFATERFHTAAPLACGPYAVRARIVPKASGPLQGGAGDWTADIRSRLAAAPLQYDFQLQFFVDEATTPIEDASVVWSESEAPYVTVARLTLPQQDLEGTAAQQFAEEVEKGIFDPWGALVEHRPLGSVMRARKAVYFMSEKTRGAL